jgi:phosphohistidine phosphatase
VKQLILIRHAKSSWDNLALPDHERPLDERGLRDAPRMAQWLVETVRKPDLAIVSTAVRARETAAVFIAAFGLSEHQVVHTKAIYEATVEDLREQIGWLATPEMGTIMLVGHNPTNTFAANQLAGASIENVPTCGVVVIGFNRSQSWKTLQAGTIQHFKVPKDL